MDKDLGENLRELLSFRGFDLVLISDLDDLGAQTIEEHPILLILDETFLTQAQFKTFIDRFLPRTPCILMTYDEPPQDVVLQGLSTLTMPFTAEKLYQVVKKSLYEYPLSV